MMEQTELEICGGECHSTNHIKIQRITSNYDDNIYLEKKIYLASHICVS